MRSELYEKTVTEREFIFTLIASNENIGAELVRWSKDGDKFTIYLKKYPETLFDEPEEVWNDYKNDAIALINKLHLLQIYHGDISEQNYVVDPLKREIKLIDYGRSCWMTDIDEKGLGMYGLATSKADAVNMEFKEVDWLFRKKPAPRKREEVM